LKAGARYENVSPEAMAIMTSTMLFAYLSLCVGNVATVPKKRHIHKETFLMNKYISGRDVNRLPLWLIKRKENGSGWHDEAYGYVVRATSSRAARKLAAECFGGDEPEDVWLDPDKSTCTRITASGEPEILLAAIRGA